MKLRSINYISPIATEGSFEEVFIEETEVLIKKNKKYMSITFEMYCIRNEERIVLDERVIAFYGMAGDSITSNKLAVLSIPNENYDTELEAVPLTIEVENPDFDLEIVGSIEYITIDNPNYESQVASIKRVSHTPLLEYLYSHEGIFPEIYDIVQWGYPNFQDALQYFDGGDKVNPNITISNPFAKEWVKNNVVMKGELIGNQFEFVNED